MENYKLFLHLLHHLKIAVLRRVSPGKYEIIGHPPAFYLSLFPEDESGKACSEPWLHSFMLESFLGIAEEFFQSDETDPVDTGFWTEEFESGYDLPLLAAALKIRNQDLIIIRCAHADYIERFVVMNKVRNALLERRNLTNELLFLKNKSSIDPLTKLFNRGIFSEFLENEIQNAGKRELAIAILMLDIDNFKAVNDKYGHLKGDHVLAELGMLIKKCIRESNDLPARYGGEEFCILSSNITKKNACALAEKLCALIRNHNFSLDTPITVSIGVTMHSSGDSLENFIGRADLALYDAKRQGKDRVCIK